MCDDSFEEHVLPYGPDKTGLHLHGLNACTKDFRTQPQDVVDAFAREWGFIVTLSTVLHSVPEVKAFTEEVGRTGSWNGEALEGFVVRTHVTTPPTKGDKPSSASPYSHGSSFFFKVKFDEPYLMYRDWREVTKMLLSKGPAPGNLPKNKLRRPETKLYVDWVCNEIKRDKEQFNDFTKGRGIIATRERFLAWMKSREGQDAQSISGELANAEDVDLKGKKVIIVPVAIPGVGACCCPPRTPLCIHVVCCRQDHSRGCACLSVRVRARSERRLQGEEVGAGIHQKRRRRAQKARRGHCGQVRFLLLSARHKVDALYAETTT